MFAGWSTPQHSQGWRTWLYYDFSGWGGVRVLGFTWMYYR